MPDLDAVSSVPHPEGLVVMWSGFLNQIPSGYLLADGFNGTSNLINHFIRGNPPSGIVGDIVGSHTHIMTQGEMPSHTHTPNGLGHRHRLEVSTVITSPKGEGSTGFAGTNNLGSTYQYKNTNAGLSLSPIGSSQPHNNQPPYYELAYIQKVT